MAVVVVGLGGNAGTEAEILARFARARDHLAALATVTGVTASPIYRTAPQGPVTDQPDFLNAACALVMTGRLDPSALVAELLAIEARLGRDRKTETPQGLRPIDLDLLLAGMIAGTFAGPPQVIVPHPRLCQRRFALAPVCDLLGPDVVIPGTGKTLGQHLADPLILAQPLSPAGEFRP